MAQIITKFIANNAVDDTKIRLPNGNYLRGRNQGNTADVQVLKINGSNAIEFGLIPQYPAANPLPVNPTDITSKFYVDQAIVASVSKFYRRPVVVNDAVDTTMPTGGTQLDGVTISNGDRVLFTTQTISGNNNRVYTVTVSGGVITAYTIAIDNDPTGAPMTGDTLWVSSGTYTKHQLTYNGTAWVVTGTDVNVENGDSITVTSLGRLNIALQTAGGLYSSSPGNPGGLLGIKLQATTPTLVIDGSNQLGVRFSTTTSGLQTGANGLALQLQATTPTLIIDGSNQLGVKFSTTASGLQTSAAGLAILLETTNPTLQIDGTGHLGAKLDPSRAITTGATGIGVNINGTNPTLKITTNALDVNLNPAGAIITSATGLLVQVEASNPTLKVNGSNQLAVNFSVTTSALQQTAAGLGVQLQASNPTLIIDGSNQLGVKFSVSVSGLTTSAAGLAILLESTNPTLQINGSNQLGVKFSATSGLTTAATGLQAKTDATGDVTIQIDPITGELRTPREKFEVITLVGTDITNQYINLQRLAQLNSVEVIAYGTEQTSGIDYTVSTVGVSRITFSGDLATGGNAALVAGDVLYVRYRSFTA